MKFSFSESASCPLGMVQVPKTEVVSFFEDALSPTDGEMITVGESLPLNDAAASGDGESHLRKIVTSLLAIQLGILLVMASSVIVLVRIMRSGSF